MRLWRGAGVAATSGDEDEDQTGEEGGGKAAHLPRLGELGATTHGHGQTASISCCRNGKTDRYDHTLDTDADLSSQNHSAVRAIWNGAVIAESDTTVIVEGNHYFPPESVRAEYFEPSAHTSVCPWKGTASYKSLNVDGERNDNAAWFYPEPSQAAAEIKDHFAFWKGVTVEEA